MKSNMEKLSGVFAPVVTPFVNDEIVFDDLRYNLKKLGETELKGYLALGSNGEFKSLTEKEQFQVLELFIEEKGDKVLMAGTSCESTKETIERSNRAAQMGFDYISVLTPSYFPKRMDGPALKDYYIRIADSVTAPILLYNAPGFAAGVQIPPKIVAELSIHPNIAGMKDSSSTGPARFLSELDHGEDFFVLAGSANFFYPSLFLGAVGGIISLANSLPEPCCELYSLYLEGRYDSARELHFRLSRLNESVSGTAGVAGVKAAMDSTGYHGREPRHPLKSLGLDEKEKIRQKIADEGFLRQ